jgi:hypothetical protein
MRSSLSFRRILRLLVAPLTLVALPVLAVAGDTPPSAEATPAPGAPSVATPPESAGSPLTVPQASIATDVKDREAVGAATDFATGVGRLYCWTRVNGAAESTRVKHVWYHGDQKVHEVELSIGGPSWRTWSYKTVAPGWTGAWRVDVQDERGMVIYSIPFTVTEKEAAR